MHEEKNNRTVTVSNSAQVIEEAQRILHDILAVQSPDAVEAAVSYTTYVRSLGLNADNYPLFFRILEIENHWVLDALLEEADPFRFLEPIPPNTFMVSRAFRMLNLRAPGDIYPRALGVIIGLLRNAYRDPRAGFNIYPITTEDVINLGKHLDPEAAQDDVYNEAILMTLEKISEYEEADRKSRLSVAARQAGKIRSFFFDNRKTLDMAIPKALMIRGDYRKREVHPSKLFIN